MSLVLNPSTKKTHDLNRFYKYTSARTAKTILVNKTLRWSSPTLFNDPFDVPRELAFGITGDQIFEEVKKNFAELLQTEQPVDYAQLPPKVAFIVQTAHAQRNPALTSKLVEGLKTVTFGGEAALDAVRQMWRDTVPKMRILCLTARPESTSMWYHYADSYTGVVIELDCSDERDSPWRLARRVNYPADPTEVFTAAGWGRLLLVNQNLVVERLLDISTYNKTLDWSYEQEWRLLSFAREGETGEFTDHKVNPRDFLRIILGERMTDQDKEEILALLKHDLAHVKVDQATFGFDRRVIFTPIKS